MLNKWFVPIIKMFFVKGEINYILKIFNYKTFVSYSNVLLYSGD